jgi:hypothetical protein
MAKMTLTKDPSTVITQMGGREGGEPFRVHFIAGLAN